jgi:hypothetical protein
METGVLPTELNPYKKFSLYIRTNELNKEPLLYAETLYFIRS